MSYVLFVVIAVLAVAATASAQVDDPAWAAAKVIMGFWQTTPDEREAADSFLIDLLN